MLRRRGRISLINLRKLVLCAQVLGLEIERIDARTWRTRPSCAGTP